MNRWRRTLTAENPTATEINELLPHGTGCAFLPNSQPMCTALDSSHHSATLPGATDTRRKRTQSSSNRSTIESGGGEAERQSSALSGEGHGVGSGGRFVSRHCRGYAGLTAESANKHLVREYVSPGHVPILHVLCTVYSSQQKRYDGHCSQMPLRRLAPAHSDSNVLLVLL